jgi:hypothetical protein
MLIGYEPGQSTSIHDYDSQMAWIEACTGVGAGRALQGQCRREVQAPWGEDRSASAAYPTWRPKLYPPAFQRRNGCATLNLYSQPIRRWRVYDERTGLASLLGTAGPMANNFART